MLKLNIDIIIFGSFLLINLVIGLFSSRRVKSLRDYAVGRRNFSTATLTATITVSWIAGMYVFEILEHTYRDGLYFIIVVSGASICLWLVSLLAVRMQEFLKNISVADAMGDLYGRIVKIITAISGVLSVVTLVAMEFKVVSRIISLIFNTDSTWTTVVAASVVIAYSVFGGIRAITFTDVVQFFTFGMFIPILALVIWNQLKDPKQVATLLSTHPNFNWSQVIGWHPKFIDTLTMFLWFIIPAMDPVVFQRISMARDVEQVKKSFTYAGILSLVVCLFLAWVAILLLANNSNLEPNKLFEYVIRNYTSAGLRGLLGIGVLALAMSTADSYLNASAVLLTNDIIKPLGITLKKEVSVARILCLLSGLLALLIALQFKGILTLLQFGNSLYMPVVTVPLLMAIFGFRSTPMAVLVGMASGFVTVVGWALIFKGGGIIPGIGANLIGLLGSHYLLKQAGGWVGIKDKEPLLAARQKRKEAWISLINTVKNTNIYHYLEENLPNREIVYFLTAIYILFTTYLGFYFLKDSVTTSLSKLEYTIFHSVLTIVAILLTYPIWNESFKNKRWLIVPAWYFSIIYIFFFLGSLLALVSDLQPEFLFAFISNLIIAAFLLPSPIFIAMLLFSLPLSWLAFKAIIGVPGLPIAFKFWHFKVIYIWMLLGSSLVIIFNLRNKYIREKAKTKRLYLEKLEVELKAKIFNILQGNTEGYLTEINLAYGGKGVLFGKVIEVLDQLKEKLIQFSHLPINTILNEQLVIQQWTKVFAKYDRDIQKLTHKADLTITKVAPIQLINQALASYRKEVTIHSGVC